MEGSWGNQKFNFSFENYSKYLIEDNPFNENILKEAKEYDLKTKKFTRKIYQLMKEKIEEIDMSKRSTFKKTKLWSFDFQSKNKEHTKYLVEAYYKKNILKNYNVCFIDNLFTIETYTFICTLDTFTDNITECHYKRFNQGLIQIKKMLFHCILDTSLDSLFINKYQLTIEDIESVMNKKCYGIYDKIYPFITTSEVDLDNLQNLYKHAVFRQGVDHVIGERIIDDTLVYSIKITNTRFIFSNSSYSSIINRKTKCISFNVKNMHF